MCADHVVCRPIRESEVVDAQMLLADAFNWLSVRQDPQEAARRFLATRSVAQTMATFIDGRIVTYMQWHTRSMRIDGRSLCSAVTGPGATLPGYRGRGLHRDSLVKTLETMHRTGHLLSAMETPLPAWHRRNGWGIASAALRYTCAPSSLPVGPRDAGGSFEQVPPDAWVRLHDIRQTHTAERTLTLERDAAHWRSLLKAEPTAELLRNAVVWTSGQGRDEGYVIYDQINRRDHRGRSVIALDVFELVGLTADAYRGLLGYLGAHNNVHQVTWCTAVDDPLPHIAADPAAIRVEWCYDKLLRVVDVPGVLQARGARPGAPELVKPLLLGVIDEHAPWNEGTWRITQLGRALVVELHSGDAHIQVEACALGPLLTGFLSLSAAEMSGSVIVHEPEYRDAARGVFGSCYAPFCADPL